MVTYWLLFGYNKMNKFTFLIILGNIDLIGQWFSTFFWFAAHLLGNRTIWHHPSYNLLVNWRQVLQIGGTSRAFQGTPVEKHCYRESSGSCGGGGGRTYVGRRAKKGTIFKDFVYFVFKSLEKMLSWIFQQSHFKLLTMLILCSGGVNPITHILAQKWQIRLKFRDDELFQLKSLQIE